MFLFLHIKPQMKKETYKLILLTIILPVQQSHQGGDWAKQSNVQHYSAMLVN
jgi:hypothetical protein